MTFNDIWEEIVRCRGNVITTKENTKFTYVVNENSIFIPKANWKITKSELEGAVKMLQNPSFAKNGRAVRLTSDVICIIPFVIAYRSISSKSIVAMPLP